MAGEGVFPKAGGDIAFASEANDFHNGWGPKTYGHNGLGINVAASDTLAHSATTWTRLNNTSTMRTTDAGANWVAATTDLANMAYGKVSAADGTKAIAFLNGNLNVAISSDSGDVWTQATVDPVDQPYCLSFPTATVAVLGTAKSAGARGIYFSTDGGDNWTICTTGPAVAVPAISMFDATTGFAIADGGTIWKTTDGGDNWTDTTHTITDPLVGTDITADLIALSATTFMSVRGLSIAIDYYDASGNASTIFAAGWTADASDFIPFNPIKLTNGDIIMGWHARASGVDTRVNLYRFKTAGDNFFQLIDIPLGGSDNNNFKDTGRLWSSTLQEYDTNKIMLVRVGGYMLLT